MKRSSFLKNLGLSGAGLLMAGRTWSVPIHPAVKDAKKLRIGIISDLHHLQFGKPEVTRLKTFMDDVMKVSPDFIIQCGDFCRPKQSEGIMAEWNRFRGPKYHVLGNHDMDVCDKATIMQLWGMEKPYYSFDQGGYHFVVMDRNFLRQEDHTLVDYNNSNWGPLPAPMRSFTDKPQLEWLTQDLAEARYPVIVFMHQPVFLSDFFQEIGNADEILAIFDEANLAAKRAGKNTQVTAVFMGHDHDDRYGERNGVHYFLLNSASYVYTNSGAHYYKDALYAFVTLDPSGWLHIEGRTTTYRDAVPDRVKARFPTSISDHKVMLLAKPRV
ncbi:metallophosphoesterase family protein [Chitinophaga sp. 22321]|uniref:Metallophosphoesterase n=1 Tax=Chitinophaga hostae TaxID=2831022 RepID=A0ABS5JAA8_9BACT|nr:metallophosphoesterase [Chitinophaga hostae]MBS0032129.1 metallophosphoesterase [Chitinophaga hostae]